MNRRFSETEMPPHTNKVPETFQNPDKNEEKMAAESLMLLGTVPMTFGSPDISSSLSVAQPIAFGSALQVTLTSAQTGITDDELAQPITSLAGSSSIRSTGGYTEGDDPNISLYLNDLRSILGDDVFNSTHFGGTGVSYQHSVVSNSISDIAVSQPSCSGEFSVNDTVDQFPLLITSEPVSSAEKRNLTGRKRSLSTSHPHCSVTRPGRVNGTTSYSLRRSMTWPLLGRVLSKKCTFAHPVSTVTISEDDSEEMIIPGKLITPNMNGLLKRTHHSEGHLMLDASFPMDPAAGDMVEVCGRVLPRIMSMTSDDVSATNNDDFSNDSTGKKELICLSDVYQTFFGGKHWSEFKALLAKKQVSPVSVAIPSPFGPGVAETSEAISPEQIEKLLHVSDTQILQGNLVDDGKVLIFWGRGGVLFTSKPQIRTRKSAQSDIEYVELSGQTLSSLKTDDGGEFVRLVDIERFLQLEFQTVSPVITQRQISQMKANCRKLGLEITKCTPNQKARLVVYANSYRHNSLHQIKLQDLLLLLRDEREHRSAKMQNRLKNQLHRDLGSTSKLSSAGTFSACASVLNSSDDEQLNLSEDDGSTTRSLDSSGTFSKIATGEPIAFNLGQDEAMDDDEAGNVLSDDGCVTDQTLLGPTRKKRRRYRAAPLLSMEPISFTVDLSDLSRVSNLAADCTVSANDESVLMKLKSVEIEVKQSPPLLVIVCGRAGERGPMGNYYNHLYFGENAECLQCVNCRKYLPPRQFLYHTHGDRKAIVEPLLYMYVDNPNSARFDLWMLFLKKLKRFQPSLLPYSVPPDLQRSYREKGCSTKAKPNLIDGNAVDKLVPNPFLEFKFDFDNVVKYTELLSGRLIRNRSESMRS